MYRKATCATKALPECRLLYSECNLPCAWMQSLHRSIHTHLRSNYELFPLTPAHYCQWRCGTPSFSCHCTPGQSGTLHPGGRAGLSVLVPCMCMCVCVCVCVHYQSIPILLHLVIGHPHFRTGWYLLKQNCFICIY